MLLNKVNKSKFALPADSKPYGAILLPPHTNLNAIPEDIGLFYFAYDPGWSLGNWGEDYDFLKYAVPTGTTRYVFSFPIWAGGNDRYQFAFDRAGNVFSRWINIENAKTKPYDVRWNLGGVMQKNWFDLHPGQTNELYPDVVNPNS